MLCGKGDDGYCYDYIILCKTSSLQSETGESPAHAEISCHVLRGPVSGPSDKEL